jgi:hypothetical protein
VPANHDTGIKGDLLYYKGDWYECTAAQEYDHTLLSHINYQFAIVPMSNPKSADTEDPPTADPNAADESSQQIATKQMMPIATEDTVGCVMVKDGSGLVVDEEGYLSVGNTSGDDEGDGHES